jgi:hypothetical protein
MIIEITPGDDARRIAVLLTACGAAWQCWLDGDWRRMALTDLPMRTDVLVEFPHNRTMA